MCLTVTVTVTDGDRDMENDGIPGVPEDYYLALTRPDGTLYYSGVRSKIRELVRLQNDKMKLAIDAGGNAYTASLDFSDVINEFISGSPIGAQTAFYEVYAQEMDAETANIRDSTQKILEGTAQKEASAQNVGAWIGALIIFGLVLLFLFNK